MSSVPHPAQERAYPMPAPTDDRRFSLGLVFDVAQVLVDHGYPPITAGGDLVGLQQALYAFLYRAPDDQGFAERFLEKQQDARRAATLADEQGREGYAEGFLDAVDLAKEVTPESVDAVSSLIARRDQLSPAEVEAIRALVEPVDERIAEPEGGPVPAGVEGHRQTGRGHDTRPPGTVAELRFAAVSALQAWAVDSPEQAALLLQSWSRRPEMTDADVSAVLEAMFPEGGRGSVPYADHCPDNAPHLWMNGKCDACGATEGGAR